jgi:hypothetical protein
VMAAGAAITTIGRVPTVQEAEIQALAMKETSYALLGDSVFSQGCMGSQAGEHGCMCPMLVASEFTGSFTLTRSHHAPPGHQAYDVTVQDWLFTFYGKENEVTGTGYYDRWTDLQGNRWHAMTLDLNICDEEVQLLSGLLEDPDPGYESPAEINIALESDTECFGYLIILDAERQPATPAITDPPPIFGGPCKYLDTLGVATIVALETPEPDVLNCPNDPVEVIFDYQPDDPASRDLGATGLRLTISEGVNPPREWVESEGLTVGSQHVCIRRDIASGTCSPLLFDFADVDYEAGIELCYAGTTFAMTVVPTEVADAIYEQQIVLLVAVDNYGSQPVAEPVHVTATAPGVDIAIEPEDIMPGQVCEVTVVPHEQEANEIRPMPAQAPLGPPDTYPPGDELVVRVRGERNGFEQAQDVSINILPGEDLLLQDASIVRDRFIPYLGENYPEFGITGETEWTPTIVKPHILVVSHYLFFSEEWEMGVMWHIMIPPYDWARIYLRHRYTYMQPQYAFEIASLGAEPPEEPYPIDPPEQVDR